MLRKLVRSSLRAVFQPVVFTDGEAVGGAFSSAFSSAFDK